MINYPRIIDWINDRVTLYNFFKNSKSKIIYCKDFPTEKLIPYIMDFQNPFKQLNNNIEYAKSLDLNYIDNKLEQGYLLDRNTNWIDNWRNVRQVLKLGYIIKNIKESGQQTPMQLIIGSEPNKYAFHPGSSRISAIIAALELKTCDLIYCWDKSLDHYPFVLDYGFEEITSIRRFLELFNDESNVYRETISNKIEAQKESRAATKLQKKLLQDRNLDYYSYDFLTTYDLWDRDCKLEKLVKASEVFEFHSDTKCSIAGINFIKQGMWIRE